MIVVDLFLLKPGPYRHACESLRAGFWVMGFLAVTGVLHGLLVALFQLMIGGSLQDIPVAEIPRWVLFAGNILSGLLTVTAVHAGITLVAWLMARATGGPGLLVGLYRATAYLLPLAWPALPQVALSVAAPAGQRPALPFDFAYLPLAVLAAGLFFIGLFQIYMVTQGRGPARSTASVALFALFSFAVLLIF